jgi:hypothetical protein
MLRTLADLWKTNRTALVAFGLALALTLFFAVRATVFAVYWADPSRHDLQPEAWMTPRYVAYSWRVDPDALREALGVVATPGRPRTLAEIAEERGIPVAALMTEVLAAVEALQAGQ